MKHILSLGAGVQSSTLALMAARGEVKDYPPLDAAIFADTQDEPQSVYRWLDWLEAEIARSPHPFPVHRVTAGRLSDASLRVRTSKKTGLTYLKHHIPAFMRRANGSNGMMSRSCTGDFKIEPIQKALRHLAEIKRGQKHVAVQQWIGISRDEIVRMKPSRLPWVENVWPLVDLDMRRGDCLRWVESNGYPKPPRSSCAYCPYHSNAEWRRLRDEEPEAFAAAIAYEKQLQENVAQVSRLDGTPFLHASRKPLSEVDFSATDPQMMLWGNECEGMCGV
jgi:hypothetical protein